MSGRLAEIRKRVGCQTDERLRLEIDGLLVERRRYMREHNGRLREDAHDRLTAELEQGRAFVSEMVGAHAADGLTLRGGHGGPSLVEIWTVWRTVTDAEFEQTVRAAIDAGDWAPITRADYQAKVDEFAAEIHLREVELERRRIEAEKAAAEAELARLEQTVAG